MKISNGTYIRHETSDKHVTEHETESFRLIIMSGIDNFTYTKVYKPVVETHSMGISKGGFFWSEFEEAITQGMEMLPKAQKEYDEEMRKRKEEIEKYREE